MAEVITAHFDQPIYEDHRASDDNLQADSQAGMFVGSSVLAA